VNPEEVRLRLIEIVSSSSTNGLTAGQLIVIAETLSDYVINGRYGVAFKTAEQALLEEEQV
jgi:hypothetical protein